jgi:FKBP-type peptidyl-prolyl cis-trans isomerase 2
MKALFILLAVTLLAIGCTQSAPETGEAGNTGALEEETHLTEQTAQDGDSVKVAYIGKLEDGSIFDQSAEGSPLAFAIGSRQVIKGFDDGVKGLKVGETRTVTILPEDGYGAVREDQIAEISKAQFGDSASQLVVGAPITASNGARGKVLEISGDTVKVDFNHALAGKTLVFEITLKEIVK